MERADYEDQAEERDFSDGSVDDHHVEEESKRPPELAPAYIKMISDQLLFEIQGVGAIKVMNGYNVYVKHK